MRSATDFSSLARSAGAGTVSGVRRVRTTNVGMMILLSWLPSQTGRPSPASRMPAINVPARSEDRSRQARAVAGVDVDARKRFALARDGDDIRHVEQPRGAGADPVS